MSFINHIFHIKEKMARKFMMLLWGVLVLVNVVDFPGDSLMPFPRSRSPKKAKGETGTPKETKAKSTPEIEQVGCGNPNVSMTVSMDGL